MTDLNHFLSEGQLQILDKTTQNTKKVSVWKQREIRVIFLQQVYNNKKDELKKQIMTDVRDACLVNGIVPCHMNVFIGRGRYYGIVDVGEAGIVREELGRILYNRRLQDRLYTIPKTDKW